LETQNTVDVGIVDVFDDFELHKGRLSILLDVVLPAGLGHVALVVEALLAEELDRVVIRVGQQILDALFLCVVFEHIHQAGAVSTHLLVRLNREENYLCELLGFEGAED
jgi:hypothetical protein